MSCVPPRSCLTTSILFPILRQWSAEHHEIGTAARLLESCKWAYDLFKPIVNRGRVVLTASNVDEVVWVTHPADCATCAVSAFRLTELNFKTCFKPVPDPTLQRIVNLTIEDLEAAKTCIDVWVASEADSKPFKNVRYLSIGHELLWALRNHNACHNCDTLHTLTQMFQPTHLCVRYDFPSRAVFEETVESHPDWMFADTYPGVAGLRDEVVDDIYEYDAIHGSVNSLEGLLKYWTNVHLTVHGVAIEHLPKLDPRSQRYFFAADVPDLDRPLQHRLHCAARRGADIANQIITEGGSVKANIQFINVGCRKCEQQGRKEGQTQSVVDHAHRHLRCVGRLLPRGVQFLELAEAAGCVCCGRK